MEAFTLFELTEHIRRVVALNFDAPVWISCEIAQIRESRGHYYLELVQKNEDTDQIVAQSSASIWAKQYWFLKKKLGVILDDLLQDGVELKVKVNVTFHERYGLKLVIDDIDTSFTLGQLELNRRKIIERLNKENKLHLNSQLMLPVAIENIAIISSATAAGLQDFISHIEENPYRFEIKHTLFESAMQGVNVESNMLARLKEIRKIGGFDLIVIIRGGGSRLDLSAFDNYHIANTISESKIPVLVGIGHDIDQAVIDLVGHTSLKTPTAVADFIVSHNADFESKLNQMGLRLQMRTKYLVERANNQLLKFEFELKNRPNQLIQIHENKLQNLKTNLKQISLFKIDQQSKYLDSSYEFVQAVDPKQLLKKGYTYTLHEGQIVTNLERLKVGEMITTQFSSGSIESEIKKKQIK